MNKARPHFLPTPAEIRAECERIQFGWSDDERRRRAGRVAAYVSPLPRLGGDFEGGQCGALEPIVELEGDAPISAAQFGCVRRSAGLSPAEEGRFAAIRHMARFAREMRRLVTTA